MTADRRRTTTPEQRERAIELVSLGLKLREAAAAVGVSHETVRTWCRDVDRPHRRLVAPIDPIEQGERKPVFVNGQRLGRLALWT
ncbi:MAG: transposase [Methylocystis sp.]